MWPYSCFLQYRHYHLGCLACLTKTNQILTNEWWYCATQLNQSRSIWLAELREWKRNGKKIKRTEREKSDSTERKQNREKERKRKRKREGRWAYVCMSGNLLHFKWRRLTREDIFSAKPMTQNSNDNTKIPYSSLSSSFAFPTPSDDRSSLYGVISWNEENKTTISRNGTSPPESGNREQVGAVTPMNSTDWTVYCNPQRPVITELVGHLNLNKNAKQEKLNTQLNVLTRDKKSMILSWPT